MTYSYFRTSDQVKEVSPMQRSLTGSFR